jgi:hypothetical protein
LLPLLNAEDVVMHKKHAEFGEPITLDLGGLGIRSIAYYQDRYIVVAGSTGGDGESHLYHWAPGQTPQRLPAPELDGLNPEAVSFHNNGQSTELLVASDDGTARVGGRECKKVKDPNLRKFRAVCLLR